MDKQEKIKTIEKIIKDTKLWPQDIYLENKDKAVLSNQYLERLATAIEEAIELDEDNINVILQQFKPESDGSAIYTLQEASEAISTNKEVIKVNG